MYVGARLDVAS